jgi:hypothetical protein
MALERSLQVGDRCSRPDRANKVGWRVVRDAAEACDVQRNVVLGGSASKALACPAAEWDNTPAALAGQGQKRRDVILDRGADSGPRRQASDSVARQVDGAKDCH